MIQWQQSLFVPDAGLYLDSRQRRKLCFVSHAHSDHLGHHEITISTPETARLAAHRGVSSEFIAVTYGNSTILPSGFRAKLLPAGHVLGSAMLHLQGPNGSLLYTGDFKLRPARTVVPAAGEQADWLLMESTYGLPMFRFPPREQVEARLIELCQAALTAGRQPIVLGYALGKAQEIIAILRSAGLHVTAHGAVFSVCEVYRELGVDLGPVRKYAAGDFHGAGALDLVERGVLVAPPSAARSPFVTRFNKPMTIVMTGWALQKGAIYRYGVDEALPLSDHADFDELLELIERVRPRTILTHHGFPEFVDHLKKRGLDARLARPAAQLELFD